MAAKRHTCVGLSTRVTQFEIPNSPCWVESGTFQDIAAGASRFLVSASRVLSAYRH